MARLIERTEQGEVAHDLVFGSTTIGRGRLNDIVIADAGERRVHAEILAVGGGRYIVRDPGSRSGVVVNGGRVEGRRVLAAGDELRVGGVGFTFEPDAPAEGAAAPQAKPQGRGFVRLTVGTMAARVFGFLRELVATAYFGLSSGIYDAYVAASTLPNLFRDVLGEQAAEGAFMPAHRTLVVRGRQAEAARLLRSVLWIVAVASVGVVAVCVAFADWLMLAVVPGFAVAHPELMALATRLSRWMMPFLLVIALASVYGSLLLADRRFWLYSLAPIGASAAMVLAVVLFAGPLGANCLVLGVLAGGVVQMLMCAAPYLGRRQGRAPGPPIALRQPALRKVGRAVGPIALAAILARLASLVDRVLASLFCVVGSLSALYEAFRVLQLPFGVFGLAVSRAAFPAMIERATAQDAEGFSRAVSRALRLNMFLMLPATVGLMVLATPVVRLLYERGRFTAADTQLTALALACYGLGLVTMGSRTVLSRAFYALLDTRTPLLVSAIDVAANIVMSLALVMTPLAHGGLALATSFASILHAWLLKVMLERTLARQGQRLVLAGLTAAVARMAAAGAVMGVVLWAAWAGLAAAGLDRGLAGRLLCVLGPGAAGMAAYVGTAAWLGCEEVRRLRFWGRH
ncbi:MAG TPA: murein biosynthesis integral membrane protein MurJ [Planctomycetota bacterium]|nr:murein biosynthesis integral membrane protein MurJ [Planctomycetota bacterium]HRR83024.1 murein biosynthesis integral membrane protein MurJ [Planctomycetota bacterium]HRT96037.1 murein biosynthesis integral membrane protein MurJ [Planctomycetota bacterium]